MIEGSEIAAGNENSAFFPLLLPPLLHPLLLFRAFFFPTHHLYIYIALGHPFGVGRQQFSLIPGMYRAPDLPSICPILYIPGISKSWRYPQAIHKFNILKRLSLYDY